MSRRRTARPLSHAGPDRASFLARAIFFAFVVLTLAVVMRPAAALAEPAEAVAVATKEDGFGRIVLTFKDRVLLPKYTSNSTNGVLIVAFDEAVAIPVNALPLELKDYISVARTDPDGSALRLALKRGIRVNLMDAGERLFIDLLPTNWTGMPPPLPANVVAELAQRAKDAMMRADQAERVRRAKEDRARLVFYASEAPTFTRLTFEWDRPFDAAFSRDGLTVNVDFNEYADIDLSIVRAQPPNGLVSISSSETANGLSIHIKLAPEAGVRAFKEGQAYIVDLTSVTDTPLTSAADVVQQAMVPGKASTDAVVLAPQSVPTGEARAADAAPAKTVEAPQRALLSLPKELGGPGTKPALVKPPVQPARPKNPEALPKIAARTPNFVRVEARRVGNSVRVDFPFTKPVAAASFRRGNMLWLVFDTPVPFDSRAMRATLEPMIRDFAISRSGKTQAIRMQLKGPLLTTVSLDGNEWVVTLGDLILEPSRPLEIERGVSAHGGAVLKVPFENAGAVHVLDDPVVGDKVYVVTGFGQPRGLIKPQSFVDLEVLPSSQGVAVVGVADDLSVTLNEGVVEIGSESGLMLSSGDMQSSFGPLIDSGIEAPVEPQAGTPEIGAFRLNPLEFRYRERKLRDALLAAPEDEQNAKRLQLARFYLAERMPNEALGILKVVRNLDPKMTGDPSFLVLMGAAETLASRPKLARAILDKPELDKSTDAAFWRTIAAVRDHDWHAARTSAPRADAVLGSYPLDLQNEFELAAATSAVELNDFGGADRYLAQLVPEQLDAAHHARYDLLRARVADAGGRSEEALVLYDRVGAGRIDASAVEAQYRALKVRRREGKISPADAAKELERLSVTWRGDEVELQVLRLLAQTSAETGNYRRAFETMKTAVVAAPDADTSRAVQDEMTAVFASLFLDHKADTMSPIDALTLYYDYRELTPPGRRGDEMVRDLANRLLDVDLLDQAAELLQHQIDKRLKGVARAQIAADLGVVYLLNHKADQALSVLSRTRQARLPASLDRQRRIVEARALAGTHRIDRALELIYNLNGTDVDRLRADILWDAERWRDAGEQIEGMMGRRWSDADPLSSQEQLDVLRAAIAYSRADDQLGLDRLRSKFSDKMADSDNARAFDVVSRPIAEVGSTVEFSEIARKIASIDTLEGFLKEYRSHYLTRDPSEDGGVPENATTPDGEQPSPDAAPEPAAPAAPTASAPEAAKTPAVPG